MIRAVWDIDFETCPACGQVALATILRGLLPAHAADNPAVILGGCCVDPDDPDFECTRCGALAWEDGRVIRPAPATAPATAADATPEKGGSR